MALLSKAIIYKAMTGYKSLRLDCVCVSEANCCICRYFSCNLALPFTRFLLPQLTQKLDRPC